MSLYLFLFITWILLFLVISLLIATKTTFKPDEGITTSFISSFILIIVFSFYINNNTKDIILEEKHYQIIQISNNTMYVKNEKGDIEHHDLSAVKYSSDHETLVVQKIETHWAFTKYNSENLFTKK